MSEMLIYFLLCKTGASSLPGGTVIGYYTVIFLSAAGLEAANPRKVTFNAESSSVCKKIKFQILQ